MKIKKLAMALLFMLGSLGVYSHAYGTEDNITPMLPSEQTAHKIKGETYSKPSLRARPDDIDEKDHAQKIPVGDVNTKVLIILTITAGGYVAIKRRNKTTSYYEKN